MHAERVETEDQLGPAIERALANRPALLDMVVTPEAVSSDGKTGLAWVPDLQPLAAWDEAERKWRASGRRCASFRVKPISGRCLCSK